MDTQGFRKRLQARNLSEAEITASIGIAERFEAYVADKAPTSEEAWNFSKLLIKEGANTRENCLALARYGLYMKNMEIYVAFLELVDGGEVGENLYRRVGERFGAEVQKEVFSGIGMAPYGTPTPDKPAFMQPVIGRLEKKVGSEACREFLSASLRDLPDEYYLPTREKYKKAGNMDAYLVERKKGFIAELESCLREGRPFFAQEITAEVIELVRNTPEMGGGLRKGNIIYETKIPYMARQFLAEKDPTLRRYYYCHCPWAREAIRNGKVKLVDTFCYCSAGFHKKEFEIIFDQQLKVEVLESALKGDQQCRFAIHLPEGVGD